MAIDPSGKDLVDIGNKVGMPDEHIAMLEGKYESIITDPDSLRRACNLIGYYDEKGDHLRAAGLIVYPAQAKRSRGGKKKQSVASSEADAGTGRT